MGRVCYHPCEGACNRQNIDAAVGINSVERFLGDEAIKRGWQFDPPAADTGKRVLVVGAGPAGLSAAYQGLVAASVIRYQFSRRRHSPAA